MVRRKHRLLSLLLSVMMIMSVLAVATVANTSAAAGDTVFCENAAGWGDVYCYMWNSDSDKNGDWPGVKMTKGDDNLWSYQITGNWENIIFNNGGNGAQTGDMTHQGNGSCYNNQSGAWSKVDVPDNPNPPTPTNPTEPDNPTPPTPTDKNVVYCKNSAGWGTVNVYMWTDGQGDNKAWPGQAATNIGDGVWMLEYTGDYKMIIFNDGGTQTGNLNHPGSGQMYDNKAGTWSLYDPSQLHIKGVTADPASPQYTGVDIKLSIEAGGGEGALSYKFTAGSDIISDFSSENTVVWTPTKAGSYTITYTVKDEAGNTKSQTATYKINDISTETKPVVKSVNVTPTNSESNEIKKGSEAVIDISAGGGNTGTKLLFYKITITDPSGKTANVPYYTTKSQYKFTPATLGEYKIEVSVQASDNATVTREYKYECVSELSAPGALSVSASTTGSQTVGSTITVKATASGGTAPYTYRFKVNGTVIGDFSSASSSAFNASAAGTYKIEVTVKDSTGTTAAKTVTITVSDDDEPTKPSDPVNPGDYFKGDADCNGNLNIKDATAIQKHVASIIVLTAQGQTNAEVDGSGQLTVKDATMIQKHLAGINVNW